MLFIIPPSYNIEEYSKSVADKKPVFTIPYGILSIISYVNRLSETKLVEAKILDINLELNKGHATNVDFRILIDELVKNTLATFKPDIVGIAALFNLNFFYLKDISNAIQFANYTGPLVIGGGVATNLYNEVLSEFPRIDAACYAEGEVPVFELLQTNNPFAYLRNSISWITRESLAVARNPLASYVENLDEIPFFDYSIIDMEQYQGRAFSLMYRNPA